MALVCQLPCSHIPFFNEKTEILQLMSSRNTINYYYMAYCVDCLWLCRLTSVVALCNSSTRIRGSQVCSCLLAVLWLELICPTLPSLFSVTLTWDRTCWTTSTRFAVAWCLSEMSALLGCSFVLCFAWCRPAFPKVCHSERPLWLAVRVSVRATLALNEYGFIIIWKRFLVVRRNCGPLEWWPLGMADLNRFAYTVSVCVKQCCFCVVVSTVSMLLPFTAT